MHDLTGNDGTPRYRQSADESSLSFPAGASKAEGIEMRLGFIDNNGWLVSARGPSGATSTESSAAWCLVCSDCWFWCWGQTDSSRCAGLCLSSSSAWCSRSSSSNGTDRTAGSNSGRRSRTSRPSTSRSPRGRGGGRSIVHPSVAKSSVRRSFSASPWKSIAGSRSNSSPPLTNGSSPDPSPILLGERLLPPSALDRCKAQESLWYYLLRSSVTGLWGIGR